jgi:hypothetical protein
VHDGFHLLVRADRVDVHVLTKLLFLGVAHVVENLRDTQEVSLAIGAKTTAAADIWS